MKFHVAGWMCWIFMSFYLESCILPDAISQWIRQRNSENATFLYRDITGDGSWIYSYDLETEQRSSQWKSPNSPRPKKARQVKSKVKSMLKIFFGIKSTVHKEFVLKGKSRFRILLWHVMATVWKCAKTSPQTLATKQLAVASRQCTISHFFFSPENFWPRTTRLSFPSTSLTWFGPLRLFSVSLIEDKTESPPFWHNWNYWGKILGSAGHPHRTRLPGCI
jgi:hypothetical protein